MYMYLLWLLMQQGSLGINNIYATRMNSVTEQIALLLNIALYIR